MIFASFNPLIIIRYRYPQDLQPFRAASTGSSGQGGGTTPGAELTESTAAEIGSTEATKEEGHTEASEGEGTAKTETATGQENPGTEKPNPGALQDDPPAKLQSPENNPKVTVTTSASGMDTTPAVATVNGAVATVTESSGAVTTVTESSGVNGTLEAPSVAASTDNGNSKLIDDPMIADGPLISNEIIRNFKDKVTNVSDSMANKASDAVGKLKKTLNDGRGSINNENLNPFPPTTPDGRNVKDGMMKEMNGLRNNIRNSMVNVSETMSNASGGKDGGISGKNSNASGAESPGGLPKAANSSVNFARDTVLEEIGGSRNNSMNASNANGSRNPTKAFDGNLTNGSLSNGPHNFNLVSCFIYPSESSVEGFYNEKKFGPKEQIIKIRSEGPTKSKPGPKDQIIKIRPKDQQRQLKKKATQKQAREKALRKLKRQQAKKIQEQRNQILALYRTTHRRNYK
ncbi:uncharacterized protein LOC103521794, partial [Diaphorina citri]|uniref:Uncharacterized protein LOC103521794 n=1 Tax=Diaphorina citri TaxID=121845 RepID=A0A1S4EQA1_DIACI